MSTNDKQHYIFGFGAHALCDAPKPFLGAMYWPDVTCPACLTRRHGNEVGGFDERQPAAPPPSNGTGDGCDCPSLPCVHRPRGSELASTYMDEGARIVAARIVRAHPFAPGTTTGTRQAWLREAIACAIEGKQAPPFVDAATVEPTAPESTERQGALPPHPDEKAVAASCCRHGATYLYLLGGRWWLFVAGYQPGGYVPSEETVAPAPVVACPWCGSHILSAFPGGWLSFCSAHQQPQRGCPRCEAGYNPAVVAASPPPVAAAAAPLPAPAACAPVHHDPRNPACGWGWIGPGAEPLPCDCDKPAASEGAHPQPDALRFLECENCGGTMYRTLGGLHCVGCGVTIRGVVARGGRID